MSWGRIRRRLNTARDWMLAAAVVVALAASAVALAILLGSGGAHAPATHRPRATQHARISVRSPLSGRTLIGVGDVQGCIAGWTSGLPILRTYHASVLRVVIQTPRGQDGQALPCVRAARAEGVKVNIAIGYSNLWSTSTIVAYFRHVLSFYGPYAWAISVGNEQELSELKGAAETPARYAAVWRAVEPVVARLAPQAIRVAGEISPWGFSFLRRAYASGLPGAQAIAVHPYAARFGFNLARVVSWARTTHLPLWATEGLTGPYAWSTPRQHPVPLSQLGGVTLASAWVD